MRYTPATGPKCTSCRIASRILQDSQQTCAVFGAVKQPFGINLATGNFKLTFYRPALDEMVDDVVSVQGAQSEYAAFEPNLGACGRRREHTGGDQPDR